MPRRTTATWGSNDAGLVQLTSAAVTDHRLANLHATVGFLQLPPRAPALQLLHRWLDSRYGLGLMVEGMTRQGSDLQARDWRADF